MRVCVTGASGFVGSALCPFLEGQGHEVVRLTSRSADLTKQGSLEPYASMKFDLIYHLAAWTQAGDFSLHHCGEEWMINQAMNTNLLTWWATVQPQAKLIAIGTSCSYDPSLPHVEENYTLGMPTESLVTYAMTKRMIYYGLSALNRQFGLRYLTVAPSTIYGPGYQLRDGKQLHFIFDLIRKIVQGKLTGEEVVLWGDGYQKRELIYIDDFIAVLVGLAGICENMLVNIGGGEEHTIREFAGMICDDVGYDPALIQYDTSKFVGARAKFLIIDKLKGLLPDISFTPLRQGLTQTIAWYWNQLNA